MSLNSEFHSRIVFSRTEFSYYLSAEFLEFFRCTQNNVFNYTFAIQKTGKFLRLQICFELFCCVQWLAVAQCTRKIKWHPWGSLSLVANHLSVEWRIVCRDACFAVYWKCHRKNTPVQTYDVGEKVLKSHLTTTRSLFSCSLNILALFFLVLYLVFSWLNVNLFNARTVFNGLCIVKSNVCWMACTIWCTISFCLLFIVDALSECHFSTPRVQGMHTPNIAAVGKKPYIYNVFLFRFVGELLVNVRRVIFLLHWMVIPCVELFI